MSRSAIISFLAGLALAALVAFFAVSWVSARHDRSTELSLAQAQRQIVDLTAENGHLVTVLSSLTNVSMPPNNDALEIARLKAEIAELRSQQPMPAPMTNLALNSQRAVTASAAAAEANGSAGLPQEAWRFSGYETAADAFESLLSAMRDGDVSVFRSSLTPDAQQTMDHAFAGMSEPEIALELQNEIGQLPVLQVDRTIQLADDEVSFVIFSDLSGQGENLTGGRAVVTFKNIGGAWKSTGLY